MLSDMIDLQNKKVVIIRFFESYGWRSGIEDDRGGRLFTSPTEKDIQTSFFWALEIVEKYGCVVTSVIDK
jgi:hypothetical protein